MSIGTPSTESTVTAAKSRFKKLRQAAWELSISGGTIALIDQAVVSATNFGTNVFVGRSSSTTDMGVYALAVSLLYFCRGFQEQLVASPYTIYRQNTAPEQLNRYSGSCLVHQIVATLVTFGFVALIAVCTRFSADLTRLTAALSVLLLAYPFFMFREFFRKLAFSQFRFSTALTMDLAVISLQLGLCGALWYFQKLGSVTVFATIALASVLACGYWLSRKEMVFEFDRTRFSSDWLRNWNFSRWALCTFFMGCSTPFLMPWFITWIRDLETSGLYFACATLVGLANMVLNGINNLLGPTAARAYADAGVVRLWNTLLKAAVAVVVLLVPFSGFVWLTSGWLPSLVLRDAAPELHWPLLLLAIQLLVSGIGTVAGSGLWAIDCPKLNIVADATLLISTFGSAFYLVPAHGVTGAALAVLFGAILAAALRWIALVNKIGAPGRAVLVE